MGGGVKKGSVDNVSKAFCIMIHNHFTASDTVVSHDSKGSAEAVLQIL